jgi:hypothetical protein
MNILDIINEHINLYFEDSIKSLTKYEREFIDKVLDEREKTSPTITKIQMIELIKKVSYPFELIEE